MWSPAPTHGLAHTSLRRWIVFCCVLSIDHWSDTYLSHPNFLTLASALARTCCEISLKLGRQRKPVSVRVALAAFSLASVDPTTRSSTDVVLCYCLRLSTTYFHDIVHRRPGQGFGEGASHSNGVHRDMVSPILRCVVLIVFCCVLSIDHWSDTYLSLPNFLTLASTLSSTCCEISQTRATEEAG